MPSLSELSKEYLKWLLTRKCSPRLSKKKNTKSTDEKTIKCEVVDKMLDSKNTQNCLFRFFI